jgi:hypothetical protein
MQCSKGKHKKQISVENLDKSAASFCRKVGAWGTEMFCNFLFVKNHKIADNSTTIKPKKK